MTFHSLGKRIIIVGDSGSGKTTLARWLARQLDFEHIELDRLHWLPKWTPQETTEFRRLTAEAIKVEEWVADGNYSKVRSLVWARADTLIWLDYPLAITLWRLLLRSWRRIRSAEILWGTNRERWPNLISWDTPFIYNLRRHRNRRKEYQSLLAGTEYAHLQVIILKSPAVVQYWKERVRTKEESW